LADPVIIGGGPAGAAAAIALASAGHKVTLIERTTCATDKVCGDFLSVEAVEKLETLGIDLSGGAPITSLRLVHRGRIAHTRLPFNARGLTRRALDEALLRQAQTRGAALVRGDRVGAVVHQHGRLELTIGTGDRIVAEAVFVATGKTALRGAARGGHDSGMVGLKMYYTLAPAQRAALREHIELTLFTGGYAGLQLVEADLAVLCILVSSRRLRHLGRRWDNLLLALTDECPHLRDRLAGARATLARPLAVAGLPYGYIHAPDRRRDPTNLFRLGDQAAVIASLTGDGVAIALASGSLAAETWLAGGRADQYHRNLAACLSPRLQLASAIHRLCIASTCQPWLTAACRRWPGVMRRAALWTRATPLAHS
jgi:menaquinone-9 beta-reductase